MSSTKRKAAKRDIRIRWVLGIIFIALGFAGIIKMAYTMIQRGPTSEILIPGFVALATYFLSGVILSPIIQARKQAKESSNYHR